MIEEGKGGLAGQAHPSGRITAGTESLKGGMILRGVHDRRLSQKFRTASSTLWGVMLFMQA